MTDLPSGTVTFLFSDIEGSTRLWEEHPDAMREALPEGVELVDLGEHRLRDVAAPIHVFQVSHPALPREFPRLRSVQTAVGNLPSQLTSFVGRDEELGALAQALGRSRLVTLTG